MPLHKTTDLPKLKRAGTTISGMHLKKRVLSHVNKYELFHL